MVMWLINRKISSHDVFCSVGVDQIDSLMNVPDLFYILFKAELKVDVVDSKKIKKHSI